MSCAFGKHCKISSGIYGSKKMGRGEPFFFLGLAQKGTFFRRGAVTPLGHGTITTMSQYYGVYCKVFLETNFLNIRTGSHSVSFKEIVNNNNKHITALSDFWSESVD